MQILAVAIYKGDERRVLRLKAGQLNVITGWSGTGKSSLLEIVEYCLGRTEPTFARGALDVVEWYGLLLQHEGSQTFVARPAPADGASSASSVMLIRGAIDVADPKDLVTNTDTRTLRDTLGEAIGIAGDGAPALGPGREPQRPTIGQALLLCFQRQFEIGKPDQLFHRATEEHVPQSIREALPYFLGAVESDHVARRFHLLDSRRDLRRVQGELGQMRQIQMDADVRASTLVSEAKAVALLGAQEVHADDVSGLREVLQRPDPEPGDQNSLLREHLRLRRARRDVGEKLRQVQEQRAALRQMREDRSAFRSEIGEQHARLRSLALMRPVVDADVCPVCEQTIRTADATTEVLRQHIVDLDSRLASERSLEPYRMKLVVELRDQARSLREEITRIRDAESAILGDLGQLARYTELAERRAFVRGRISQFLEALRIAEPGRTHLLEKREAELMAEIARLEEALDPAAVAREVEAKLHFVNEYMTAWARELDLEHSQDGIGLSISELTLYANNRQSPIPLYRIGAGANQVGYHVVAHLALHRWFVEERRPVPNFLFLDQPEQAYYPEDMPTNLLDPNTALGDRDQQNVLKLYTFLRDVTEKLAGSFQTIVVGHWNPANVTWFPEVCIANWREDGALVPNEWLEVGKGL